MKTKPLLLAICLILSIKAFSQNNQQIKIYHAKAYQLQKEKKLDSALIFAEENLKLLEKLSKSDTTLASMLHLKGRLYQDQRKYNKAIKAYQQLFKDKFSEIKDTTFQFYIARAYNDAGSIYQNRIREYKQATKYLELGINICQKYKLTHKHIYAALCVNLGGAYTKNREFTKALFYLNKSNELFRKIYGNQSSYVAIAENSIGSVFYQLRRFKESIKHRVIALSIAKKNQQRFRQAYLYMNIASSYGVMDSLDVSIAYLDSSRAISSKIKNINPFFLMSLYNNSARNFLRKRDHRKAMHLYHKALNLAKKQFKGKHPTIAYYYARLADASFKPNKNYKAYLVNIQKSLVYSVADFHDSTNIHSNPRLNNYLDKFTLFRYLSYKAEVMANYYEVTKDEKNKLTSIKTFALCDSLIEKIQRDFGHQRDLINIGTEAQVFYTDASRRLWIFGEIEKSFEYSQKSKAEALRVKFLETNHLANNPLLNKKRKLLQKIRNFQRKNSDSAIYYAQQHDLVYTKLRQEYPAYEQALKNKTVTIAQIQQKLDRQTAYLEYTFSRGDLFIKVITNRRHYFQVLDRDKDSISSIKKVVQRLRVAIETAEQSTFAQASHKLYTLIFKPIERYLSDKSKLVIVPGGSLLQIPFDALLYKKASKFTLYPNLPYLINKYQIQYHFSSLLWYLSQSINQTKVKNNAIAAFAPIFDNQGGYVVDSITFKNAKRAINPITQQWDSLPYSKEEVEYIVKYFLKNKYNKSKAFIGSQASEHHFKKYGANYNYLHLATHSLSNNDDPAYSFIKFTTDSISNRKEDGSLYLDEIYNLRLNSKLVVLSSCDSGMGRLENGEGAISLSRAFLYAGAQNIIFSLWSVNDKATQQQMTAFYQNVFNKSNYAQALHLAKLKMIKTLKIPQPLLWAGFILVGK